MQLAAALQPLASLKQFVLCRIDPAPKPDAPWKTNKVPLDPTGFVPGDAQSPKNWLDAETAFTLATRAGGNYAVGFVLTRDDPLWCIDLDDCSIRDEADQHVGWTPEALTLCEAFPGAVIELSDSGRGLHIWGCGRTPEHGKKRGNLEFYTELRFIALGRAGQASGAFLDWTPTGRLEWLVASYFPPSANDRGDDVGDPLSTEPLPEWRGPADDDELLRRALRSQSTANKMGHGASFADLFDANVEVLSRAYPSPKGDDFDRSSADQALASHLAFWTGAHGERIERLMQRSGLKRDKWDERGDYYMRRTINPVCQPGRQVYVEKEAAVATPPEAVGVWPPHIDKAILFTDEQKELFAGCTVLTTKPTGVLLPDGRFKTREEFETACLSWKFMLQADNQGAAKAEGWTAITKTQCVSVPRADGFMFRPDLPFGTIGKVGRRSLVNVFYPPEIRRLPGDPARFLNHVAKLFPDPRDQRIFLSWMAAIVQYPGIKFPWAMVVQGTHGNGKGILWQFLSYAVGGESGEYVEQVDTESIESDFRKWLVNKVLYLALDIHPGGNQEKMFNKLKLLITERRQSVQGKGVDRSTEDICGNFAFDTNFRQVLAKTEEDRRLCVLHCAQQLPQDKARDGMTSNYFSSLGEWMRPASGGGGDGRAIVADFLLRYEIEAEFDPTKQALEAPRTSAYETSKEYGKGEIELVIEEAIKSGTKGFNGGWVNATSLAALLEGSRARGGAYLAMNARKDLLSRMGYGWHPSLREGRSTVDVGWGTDRKKSVLYIRKDHPDCKLTNPDDIARAYETAQAMPDITVSAIPFGQPETNAPKVH